MPFLLILIAAVLILAAYNNTYGELATELETDVPGFAKWGLAIVAVGALQWIPGMRVPARWLLALVIVVIVLRNYQALLSGVQNLSTLPAPATASPTPAAAYAANPASPQITAADTSGGLGTSPASTTTAASVNAANQPATVSSPLGIFDPSNYLAQVESGFGGAAPSGSITGLPF
jgi:hypothetical protein